MPPKKVKGTENSLYGFSIYSKFTKKSELVDYLKALHEDLSNMEQDVSLAPRGLQTTASHLIESKIMENPDKEVRVLACCCIADILRIYAPEAPYKESDMVSVFQMLFTQIRGLETNNPTSVLGSKMLYILSSLATVKSCVVPVIMANHGITGASDVVRQMFETVLDIIVNDMPEQVYSFCAEILQACIEEFDGISEELLNVLLLHLLPSNKNDRPIAYKVVAVVLKSVQPLVQKTLVEVVHHILVGTGSKIKGVIDDEIIEDIYPLIYELHQIMPEIMAGILPSLTQQLHVEEGEIRQKAVKLLCALYQSDEVNYVKEFSRDFKEFVGRLNDLSAPIRTEVMNCCCTLMQNRSDLHYLEESIAKRLRDPEEEVRALALNRLIEFAQETLVGLSVASIQEIAERAKDKKTDIRKAAIEGLAKIYYRHLSSKITPLDSIDYNGEDSLTTNISSDVVERVRGIPSVILKTWGFPEITSKYMVLHALQEYLLPKPQKFKDESNKKPRTSTSSSSSSDKDHDIQEISLKRATALLFLFFNIDDLDKQILGAILTMKGQVNRQLEHFVKYKSGTGKDIRLSGIGADNRDEYDAVMEMKQALYSISQMIPSADRKQNFFDKLLTTKDKFVSKLIKHCISAEDSITDSLRNREDLQRRLDSKSPLGEYMGIVYDFGSHMFCDAGMIESILDLLTNHSIHQVMLPVAQTLEFVAKFSSKAFASTAPFLSNWMERVLPDKTDKAKSKQIKEEMFESFVNTATDVGRYIQGDHHKLSYVNRILHYLNALEQPKVCLKLALVLCHVVLCCFDTDDSNESNQSSRDAVYKFIKQCCSKKNLSDSNSRLLHHLSALFSLTTIPDVVYTFPDHIAQVTLNISKAIRPVKDNLWDFLQNELMSGDSTMDIKGTGLKLWSNMIYCDLEAKRFEAAAAKRSSKASAASNDGENARAEYEYIENLIFECLQSRGTVFNSIAVDETQDQNKIYQACAVAGFLLIKIQLFGMTLTPERWHELAWTMLHDDKVFRSELVTVLSSIIQTRPVHLKFLSLPCLMANDSDLADSAHKSLVGAVRKLRKTQEDLVAKISTEKDETKRAAIEKLASRTMPEMILPYLLHLLSYHPDFPTSVTIDTEDDKRRMKSAVRCVQMLLQALQSTLSTGSSNLPFLFKQLNTINRSYVDRLDPENVGLHFVTRLAVRLLNDQVKTAENVQVHPGEIQLPRELFVRSKEGTAQMQLGKIAAFNAQTEVGLEIAEHTIEKAIEIAGKSRGKAGLLQSPSKPRAPKASPGSAERKRKDRRQSNDDEEQADERRLAKKQKAEKPRKEVPTVAPSRVLPGRSVKGTVQSYAEKDEYDSDIAESDDERKPTRRRASSSSQQNRLSTSSTQSINKVAAKEEPFANISRLSNASQISKVEKSSPPSSNWNDDDEDEFDIFKSQNLMKADESFEKLRATKRKFSNGASQNEENEVPVTATTKVAKVADENITAKKNGAEGKDNVKAKGLSVRPANRLSADTKNPEQTEINDQPSKTRKGRSIPIEEPEPQAPVARSSRGRPIRA